MAVGTMGTTSTTGLTSLVWNAMSPVASVATIAANITGQNAKHTISPGAFGKMGRLHFPSRRGFIWLNPGDVVAYDNYGWPVVVSSQSIAQGNSWVSGAGVLGNTATNSLVSIIWNSMTAAADLATISAHILSQGNPTHPIQPGALSASGRLVFPGRKSFLLLSPGDYVGYDNFGWPVVVSKESIANGSSWTHSQ